jgi:hypothetical protein
LEILKGLHKRQADQLARAVEGQVAEFLNRELGLTGEKVIDPNFVIAHSYSIKSARESSRNDDEGILVNVKPAPQPFIDESTLFKSINETYSENWVVVFAPIEWPDPDKKDELRAGWRDRIRGIIQAECKQVKK